MCGDSSWDWTAGLDRGGGAGVWHGRVSSVVFVRGRQRYGCGTWAGRGSGSGG
jgi:hypothetical protein